jgi:hypothetical protein
MSKEVKPREWQIEKNSKVGHTLIRGPDTIGVVGQLTRVRVVDLISYTAVTRERDAYTVSTTTTTGSACSNAAYHATYAAVCSHDDKMAQYKKHIDEMILSLTELEKLIYDIARRPNE